MKTFRLFISSTFSDFNQERRLLQSYVFPMIKEYCVRLNKGYTFQPIDLRWGVSNEAQLDQKTVELCLEEVRTSKSQPHPNFLIMAGDRYGWVPIPYVIEKSEFDQILQYHSTNNTSIEIRHQVVSDSDKETEERLHRITDAYELLNQWYCLDENQIPASYILQERRENCYGNYLIYEHWESEERYLREILQKSVIALDFDDRQKHKYFTSATEHEVLEGILQYLDVTPYQEELIHHNKRYKELDYDHVYGYLRNIKSIQKSTFTKYFLDDNSIEASRFKDTLKETIKNENLLETDADLKELSRDTKNGSLNYQYKALEGEENSQFVKTMFEFLKKTIDSYDAVNYTQKELEKFEQKRFKDLKLKLFIGRDKPLEAIEEYIKNSDTRPLVIYGKSGLGKSSLMAKSIDNAINAQSKRVIYRFVGVTSTLNDSPSLLISILAELGIDEGIRKVKNPRTLQEESENIEEFYYRVQDHLTRITEEKIVFIDAVDQLSTEDIFLWLPKILPNNLKIIISALKDENYPDDSRYLLALEDRTSNLYKLEAFQYSQELIHLILKQYGRTLTDKQMQYLLSQPDSISPLYLIIAAQELRHWKSCAVEQSLAPTQQEIILEYIQNLYEIYYHDKEFVERVLHYLYLSEGLSEFELIEVLSVDERFIEYIAPETFHNNVTKELPVVIWSRLHAQLKEFLKFEFKDGQETINFFHREFKDVLFCQPQMQVVHEYYIALLQTLMIKYQHEGFDTNRWGVLYIRTVKDYHIAYEFDYLPKDSKIKEYGEFISTFENGVYQNAVLSKLSQVGLFYNNNKKVQNAIYKLSYHCVNVLYSKSQDKWAEDFLLSLHNLSVSLNSVARFEDGNNLIQKVVSVARELYRHKKDIGAKYLIGGLSAQGTILSRMERFEEAITLEKEAVDIAEGFYRKDEENRDFSYTGILINLTSSLTSMNRIEEAIDTAKKAVDITKELYSRRDEAWIIEERVDSLINYALSLKSVNRFEEAIDLEKEAVDITKELYSKDEETWARKHVRCLTHFANSLKSIHRDQEAVQSSQEAIDIAEILYLKDEGAWVLDYVKILYTYSFIIFSSVQEKALESATRAVRIAQRYYNKYQTLWANQYVLALNNLTHLQMLKGKTKESLKNSKVAIDITRQYYNHHNKERWAGLYTYSLLACAKTLSYEKRFEEAIDLEKEAVDITQELFESKKSNVWAEKHAVSLVQYAWSLLSINQKDSGFQWYQKAHVIIRELYNQNQSRWLEYTKHLVKFAMFQKSANKIEGAFVTAKEAINIRRERYNLNKAEQWLDFTEELIKFAYFLNSVHKDEDAVEVAREIIEIRRFHYMEKPNDDSAKIFIGSLLQSAKFLKSKRKILEAIELEREAIKNLQNLYDKQANQWNSLLSTSFMNLASSLRLNNEFQEAGELEGKANRLRNGIYSRNGVYMYIPSKNL